MPYRRKGGLTSALGNATYVQLSEAPLAFNDPRVGGVLDDSTDNGPSGTNALANAATLLGSRGGSLFMPRGIARFTSQPASLPTNVKLAGEGKNASILRKAFTGAGLIRFEGASTSTRVQRGGLRDLQVCGDGTHLGALLTATYADHLNFDDVWFNTHPDSAVIFTEVWDSYFKGCEFENVSGADGLKPAIMLQSSATDSTNNIWFTQCRWEQFKDGALWVATGGLSGANVPTAGSHPVYGVYLDQCKMETVYTRGAFINFSNDVLDFHADMLELAADSLDSGLTSANAPNLVNFVPNSFCTFQRVRAYVNGNAARTVFRMFPGATGHSIRDVIVDAQTALGVGIIEFAGGSPVMSIKNVGYKSGQSGTIYSGTPYVGTTLDDLKQIKSSTQTANYTLALIDADTVLEMNAASGVTVTVPPNSSVAFPIGTIIEVHQYGAGQVTVAAGAGVTLRTSSSLTARAQYSTVSLRKRATDEWIVVGDLT